MAEGGISYRIELDSADAEQALQRMQGGVVGLTGAVQQLASAFSGGGFAAFATLATAAATAAAGLTTALFGMAKASSSTVDELGEMAAQMGSSVEEMSTLRSALGQLEANTSTLQRAFERMGNTIQSLWPQIAKDMNNAANQIAQDQINVERTALAVTKAELEVANAANIMQQAQLSVRQSTLSLAQAQVALARSSADAAREQRDNALSVREASLSVRDAEIALAQARGQHVSEELLRKSKIERAELALSQARSRAVEARERADRAEQDRARQRAARQQQVEQAELGLAAAKKGATEAEIQVENNLLQVQQALVAAIEALNKQHENETNNINTLKKQVDDLASGASKGADSVGTSVDNMIRGLIASVGPAVATLDGVGGSLNDLMRQSPQMRTTLLKLADVFKNMEDSAKKMAIATKLFGRKDARSMVESLSVGSEEILRLEERMKSLGLVITETDDEISKKFIASMNRLGDVTGIISTQFGLLFQPGFTDILNDITGSFETSREKILQWGMALRDTVMPILQTFARVLFGIPQAGVDDWLVKTIDSFTKFGQVVSTVLGAAFSGLLTAVEFILEQINTIFGTKLNALDVLLVAFAASIAAKMGAALLAAFGVWGLAILALLTLLGLLIKYWPQISKAAVDASNFILTKWNEVKAFFNEFVTTPVENAWQWVKDKWDELGIWIKTKIEQAKALIREFVTTPVENAWQWMVDTFNAAVGKIKAKALILAEILKGLVVPGSLAGAAARAGAGISGGEFAGGGLLDGRGTGTSDSNLAWVSRGEYITPARAVSQPGVLAFLEALRRSGGDLRRVLDGMSRFALGGLVRTPLAIPAFAGGGGMNNVTIQFPGLPEITGLRASSGVVDELRKAAAMAQVRSGGRKPSRYS